MNQQREDLAGKVVLVTGGSRGLGAAMVHGFASAGAPLIVASRKYKNCGAVADEANSRYGVRALPVAFNVSDWSECDALAEKAYAEFGQVDVLINNAGLSPLYPGLDQITQELFDKIIAVNLRGPFRLTALIGTRMAASGGGSIINIGSIEAMRPQAEALPYAAAKAGLHVLSEGFAKALGPLVRVNTIQAGPFLTDIAENWPNGLRAQLEASVALGRCGEPSEIVGAALFFATSSSSYITGAVLRVDGGFA